MLADPNVHALVYKTLSAALAVRNHAQPDMVVTRAGRRFALVKPETAKRLKLKIIQN